MNDFKDILNDLVMQTGLSFRKLSAKSGVSAIQYSRYTRGTIPTIPVVLRMAKFFQCSLDYMFGLDFNKNSKKFNTYNYDMKNFIDRYDKLLKKNNLTHFKFTQNCFFNERTLRHWKSGSTPRLDIIYYIAKELDGSIDDLIGRK